jgi:hypothetical protein
MYTFLGLGADDRVNVHPERYLAIKKTSHIFYHNIPRKKKHTTVLMRDNKQER